MPSHELIEKLETFAGEASFLNKGPLCVALVTTRIAMREGLPLEPAQLLTERGGQVMGLGKGAVQKILAVHSITRVLAAEGGRTSRGSIDNMREYVGFLNSLYDSGLADLESIEEFWIEKVRSYFNRKPLKLKYDPSRSLREIVRDVIIQAIERQRESGGTMYAGAVLQHLVGAKLECALGNGSIEHNSFSTSDEQSGRAGDFLVNDVAIHVTTAPGDGVLERCQENLENGQQVVIVTLSDKLEALRQLAENHELSERIDYFDVEQFISLNLFEFSKFKAAGRKPALDDIIRRYNEIITAHETDASLRVEI